MLYIYVYILTDMHTHTHIYLYMHHIVFVSHAWHLHHCALLSYQLMVPEAEQQIYADRPTAFLFLNMAITGWP